MKWGVFHLQTVKLYEQDSYRRRFSAQVLSCAAEKGNWAVILNQTCFFPEGGGQPCDIGTLGAARVREVHIRAGEIIHLVDRPLEPGSRVEGEIDWDRRFDLTQQHSGEHIVSGIIHRLYGYDNVGFHMGADTVTVDWNGPLTRAQLAEIEEKANEILWADRETEIFVPSREELEKLDYRSKRELEGDVRIVRFPGADTCACCGTHVRRAGEVGLIRILSAQKLRDGVRCEMVSGRRALEYDRAVGEQNHRISVLLSAKERETASAVQKLQDEAERMKLKLAALEGERCQAFARRFAGAGNTLLLQDGLDSNELRRLTVAVMETCGGICAAFSAREVGGCAYCLGQRDGDLRLLVKELNQTLDGRGGGKPFFAQGAVKADRAAVERFFRARGWLI